MTLIIERGTIMKTVEISDTLFAEVQKLATPLVDNFEDVIWRLMKKEKRQSNNVGSNEKSIEPTQYVFCKGGMIPCHLTLRMKYKGATIYGETKVSGIYFENMIFKTPSAAACHVAKMKGVQNPSFDGWKTIEYLDEDSKQWEYLDYLRNETGKTKTVKSFSDGKKSIGKNVTGRKPLAVILMNKRIDAGSWKDVKVVTFNKLLEKFPNNSLAGHFIEKNRGHTPYQLCNGKFIEVNRGAESICKHCREAVKACGLIPGKDWEVELR